MFTSLYALAQVAAPEDVSGVDVVGLLEQLLPFVPESARGWVVIGLFGAGMAGYMYVSVTASKDDDTFFNRYFGGFKRLQNFLPKKKDPPSA